MPWSLTLQTERSSPDQFLQRAGWGAAEQTALAGDASGRRYIRLRRAPGDTAVLMVSASDSGDEIDRFLRIARHLKKEHFSAPEILDEDRTQGLLLLEDLGDALFARLATSQPDLERKLYESAVDFLAALHSAPVPKELQKMSASNLARATDLSTIWYANAGDGAECDELTAEISAAFEELGEISQVLVLRDFHAENLIWLEHRQGDARVGLLDFQDALIGHRTYDLISLVFDARRDLQDGLAENLVSRYARAVGYDLEEIWRASSLFCVQRNLRILGVFARLSLQSQKTAYLDHIPRVWHQMLAALESPHLHRIGAVVHAALPAPDDQHLAHLKPK